MDKMIEKLRREYERLQGNDRTADSSRWMRLPKEPTFEVRVRILPAPDWDSDDPSFFFARFGQHWINRTKYFCPQEIKGEHCPICEAAYHLYAEGDEKRARELRVSKRGLIQVVEAYGNGQYGDEPRLLEVPKSLLDTIIAYCLDDEYGNITHPKTGTDFKIIRTRGDNGFASYTDSRPVRRSTEIPDEQFARIMANAFDVNEVVKTFEILPRADLEAVVEEFLGGTALDEASKITDIKEDELLEEINKSLEV